MTNTTVIQVRLPDEELTEVERRAADMGLAPSAWTKALIYKELGLGQPVPAKKIASPKPAKAKKVAKKATKAKKKASPKSKLVVTLTAPMKVEEGTVTLDPEAPVRNTTEVTLNNPTTTTAKCPHPKDQLKKFTWGSVCGVCNTRVR